MEIISKNQSKELLLSNANLFWIFSLWEMYRQETDKPEFADFMSWLQN